MPDVILENARIWSKDSKQLAESAVIADGRFVFVGKRSDAPRRPGAKIIDARGKVVLPGLIDSHIHMLGGGRLLSSLFLGEVKNKNEFIEKIRQHARTLPQTAWVTAWGWSVESWQNPQQPVKEWIDECTGNRPAFLQRMDFHSVLVNSAALKSAGITRHGPPDPPGGKIERHPRTGEPTGILREAAVNLVQRLLPRPTLTDQFNALKTAIDEALKHGITTVADIPFIKELPAYEKLAQDNPRVRFFLYPIARDWASAAKQINSFRGKQGFVSAKGLKTFIDGTLGSRTALMHQPYLPQDTETGTGERGIICEGIENGGLEKKLRIARNAGLQPMAHAIGDAAVTLLLDAYEKVFAGSGIACRVEHAQHIRAEDIPRFAELNIIASMQPLHKAGDALYMEKLLGESRSSTAYRFRDLYNSSVVVAFGSDWPVVSLNPFPAVETAVHGTTLTGSHWQTEQNINIARALEGYTCAGAQALGAGGFLGCIEPGYLADFVILDQDPFAADTSLAEIAVAATFVQGELVFAAPGWS